MINMMPSARRVAFLIVAVVLVCVTRTSGNNNNKKKKNGIILPLSKRYGVRSLRSRRDLKSYPIVAENDGVWYSKIHIGTPPQIFTAIVDTGSATIAVPCDGCSCGSHNHFKSSESSTAQSSGRTYSQCYGEGSCNRGKIVSDQICLGDTCSAGESVSHSFGCCTTYASAFKTQEADGIIGISGSSGTLIADLRNHHKLSRDIFGICLGLRHTGFISIGSVENDKNFGPVPWTVMHRSGSFYKTAIDGIYVNGNDVDHGSHVPSATVDSGTSFTYIPTSVHSKIKATFESYCNNNEDNCKGVHNPRGGSSADISDSVYCAGPPASLTMQQVMHSYPSISFKLEGGDVDICVPPEQYFFLSTSHPIMYCVGFFKDRDFVFGANLMANFNVLFDHEHDRMGWVRADCESKGPGKVPCCGPCQSTTPQTTTTTAPPNIITTTTASSATTQETTTSSSSGGNTPAPGATTTPPLPTSTTTKAGKFINHENELKKEFNVVPISNSNGYSLFMKKKSISNFALWGNDVLYINTFDGATSEICYESPKNNAASAGDDVSTCHFAAGSKVVIKRNIHVKVGSITMFNLELEDNSRIAVRQGAKFKIEGVLKSSGTIDVGSNTSFTMADFVAASPLSKLVFHHKTRLICLSNGKFILTKGEMEIRGHMQSWCNMRFEQQSTLTVVSSALLDVSSGILSFEPGTSINFLYGPTFERFGLVSVAGDATLNGNINLMVQSEANDEDSEKYPFEVYSLIKGVNMIGDFASINFDRTFKCMNSSVIINLVSASIAFQRSCFMECWKGSGSMTKECIAAANTNNNNTGVENIASDHKKDAMKKIDEKIAILLWALGGLLLLVCCLCLFIHYCCTCCSCCESKSKKYKPLDHSDSVKMDTNDLELVNIETKI
jgi:hypothetical protein